MRLEDERRQLRARSNRPQLPPELTAFLVTERFACVTQATSLGTAYVCKVPALEIDRLPKKVLLNVHHELRRHPAAPVIRTLIRLFDQPRNPIAFETFINVADPDQRADFAALATQPDFLLLLYDERLAHQHTLRAPTSKDNAVNDILAQADKIARIIPPDRYDFDTAKADVMARTSIYSLDK